MLLLGLGSSRAEALREGGPTKREGAGRRFACVLTVDDGAAFDIFDGVNCSLGGMWDVCLIVQEMGRLLACERRRL